MPKISVIPRGAAPGYRQQQPTEDRYLMTRAELLDRLDVFWVGRHWGEQVLNWRLVRLVLSTAREQWLNAAYRRHALKTVVTGGHVMGLRAAAFLTAGSARVPFWKFVVADAGAALFGVPLAFGLTYFFTDQIKPSWPMCTGQSAGSVSPASWRLR